MSSLSSSEEEDRGKIAEPQPLSTLIRESQQLQQEINTLFSELSGINKAIRADINEFCNAYESSVSSINFPSHNHESSRTRVPSGMSSRSRLRGSKVVPKNTAH